MNIVRFVVIYLFVDLPSDYVLIGIVNIFIAVSVEENYIMASAMVCIKFKTFLIYFKTKEKLTSLYTIICHLCCKSFLSFLLQGRPKLGKTFQRPP